MPMSRREIAAVALTGAAGLSAAAAATADSGGGVTAAGSEQSTQLISRAFDGGVPNGPSTSAVISGDRRYARVIAFESEATNLVRGDTNGTKDVFAVKRRGRINNKGTPWSGGRAIRVSRGVGGKPADGESYGASVSGDFRHKGSCIAFLSNAGNLVAGDTNDKADAFLVRSPGARPRRVSLPNGRQASLDTTAVAVSGDCSRISFVTGDKLYTRVGSRKPRRVSAPGAVSDPSYATGNSNALVYAAPRGVFLSANGTGRGKLVAPGGRNPVFNDIKRRTLAYEKTRGSNTQIFYRDLGKGETIISDRGNEEGDGDSRDPVIGNSGFYVMFESEASNLGLNPSGATGDDNGQPDSYLFTDVRNLTLVQSVQEKAEPLPGGGQNPSMSFYANYVVFDSPGPLGAENGAHQVFMRYLGAV